mmetsp:Transcript_5821/g.737  ORF Transcript_5821/g.737 Transcript_5821/m.737 type:complete len:105 (+) Transcript_5821:300-614(+)
MLLIKLRKYTGLILICLVMASLSGGVFTTVGYYTADNLYHMAIFYERRLIIIQNSWYFLGSGLTLLIAFSLLFLITSYIGSKFSQDLRKTCITTLMYKDLQYYD